MTCDCATLYDSGSSPCLFCDWFGVGDPRVSEAWTGLEGAECSVKHFDSEIEDIYMQNTFDDALPFCGMAGEADWLSTFIMPSPFYPQPASPSLMSDDASSSAGSVNDPLSPMSEAPPFSPSIGASLSGLTLVGDEQLSHGYGDMAPIADDFPFTFTSPSPSVSCSSYFPESPSTFYSSGVPELGYGQMVSQHEVGAAATGAHGLGSQDVQGNANECAFPSTIPEPPSTDQDPLVPATKKRSVKKHKNGDEDEDEYEEQPRSQKRRRQSTEPKHPCPDCSKKFARTHNLRVHIDSVHKGKRANACTERGCERSFSRKHDLMRHIQSKHTDLGSPRRKSPKVAKDEESE